MTKASFIKGIAVRLINKKKIGEDRIGSDITEDVEILVENVLIRPVSSDEMINELNLSGRKIIYELAIPKTDTNTWTNSELIFFNERFRVINAPVQGIDELIPLDWNKKVMVEKIE